MYTRLDTAPPGGRSTRARCVRAGQQQAEAPGPALCRPVAIYTRLGANAGSTRGLGSSLQGKQAKGKAGTFNMGKV